MVSQMHEIQSYLLKAIPHHKHDVVTLAMHKFDVSRTTVHHHLSQLIKKGLVIKTGETKATIYTLVNDRDVKLRFDLHKNQSEFKIWTQYFNQHFEALKKNLYHIFEYAFTEIVNNAYDHSEGKTLVIETQWSNDSVSIIIQDDGIGIFKKLGHALHYDDVREAAFQLTKGKLTTDPHNHTGEGIFFTSRAMDLFVIQANNLEFTFDNINNDWYVKSTQTSNGTKVIMSLGYQSTQQLIQLFQDFQEPDELSFDRTEIVVELSKLGDERYISRSQAKRVCEHLERFHRITLDFRGVDIVGQAFVDQVFRVFQNQHPTIQITYRNANDDVEFMIKRGLATARK